MDERVVNLSEKIIDRFLDYPRFASWFDELTDGQVNQIYAQLNDAISVWIEENDEIYTLDD